MPAKRSLGNGRLTKDEVLGCIKAGIQDREFFKIETKCDDFICGNWTAKKIHPFRKFKSGQYGAQDRIVQVVVPCADKTLSRLGRQEIEADKPRYKVCEPEPSSLELDIEQAL